MNAKSKNSHIRVLSWNLRFQGFGKRIEGITKAIESKHIDVLTFQEVPEKHSKDFFSRLEKLGYFHLHYAWKGTKFDSGKWIRHGVVIASMHKVEVMGNWIDQAKFPDLFAHVKIFPPSFPEGIEFITAHIPNGSGYGWIKIEHFRILSQALIESPSSPRVLTGDFNEPQAFLNSGQIVSFRTQIKKDGGVNISGIYSKNKPEGIPQHKAEWGRSVRDVLSHHAHGMKNVYEQIHGMHPTPVTHLVRGTGERCFDHGFASRHCKVIDSGYHHEWRKSGLSDHSPLWFEIRPQQTPPMIIWDEK
jgi:endonuclease/exonuclease/phosphatase family metal-dependent hydrolase